MAALAGAAVLSVAGCSSGPADTGVPTVPGATKTEAVTPEKLAMFFGNGLTVSDRGSFGLELGQLIITPDAPGGTMLRVGYPAGLGEQAGRRGRRDAGVPRVGAAPTSCTCSTSCGSSPASTSSRAAAPGLYGGTVTSGQTIPDGTDGFSTRYMWRVGGDGEVYAYLPTSEDHGTSLGRGCWFFPRTSGWRSSSGSSSTPRASDGEVTGPAERSAGFTNAG